MGAAIGSNVPDKSPSREVTYHRMLLAIAPGNCEGWSKGRQPIPYSKTLYRQRSLIERMCPPQGLSPHRDALRQVSKKCPR